MKMIVTMLFYLTGLTVLGQEKQSDITLVLLDSALAEDNPIIAKKILLENLELAKNKSDSCLIAFYNQLGFVYSVTLQNDSALYFLNASIEMTSNRSFQILRAFAYSHIGNVYRVQSENEQAMAVYNLGLDELTGNDTVTLKAKSKIFGNIGGIYYDLNRPDKALEYANLSYQIDKKYDFKDRLYLSQLMLAFAYRAMGNLDSALLHNLSVLELLGTTGNSPYLAYTYYNIGTIYSEKNDFNIARDNFQKSKKIALEAGVYEVYVSDLIETAKLYRKMGDLVQSINSAKEAVTQSIKYSLLTSHIESLDELQKSQKLFKDFRGSVLSLEQIILLKDSLFRAESMGKIQEVESKYQKKENLQKIHDLESTAKIQNLEAMSAKQLRVVLLIILVLLIFLVLVLYNRYRLKSTTSKALDEKNNQLNAANEFKNRILAIVSHDLKSPLSSFSSITSTLNEYYDQIKPEDVRIYLSKLSHSARTLEEQMKNLLEWAISQLTIRELKLESISILESVQMIKGLYQLNLEIKQIQIYCDVPGDMVIWTDREYFHTILRNLVSNAIKFTPINGSIWISALSTGDQVSIQVKDSGIGIAREHFDQLFSLAADKKAIGSSTEKGTGLGLVLVKELMDRLDNQIHFDSKLGEGTIFTLEFQQKKLKKVA